MRARTLAELERLKAAQLEELLAPYRIGWGEGEPLAPAPAPPPCEALRHGAWPCTCAS